MESLHLKGFKVTSKTSHHWAYYLNFPSAIHLLRFLQYALPKVKTMKNLDYAAIHFLGDGAACYLWLHFTTLTFKTTLINLGVLSKDLGHVTIKWSKNYHWQPFFGECPSSTAFTQYYLTPANGLVGSILYLALGKKIQHFDIANLSCFVPIWNF